MDSQTQDFQDYITPMPSDGNEMTVSDLIDGGAQLP